MANIMLSAGAVDGHASQTEGWHHQTAQSGFIYSVQDFYVVAAKMKSASAKKGPLAVLGCSGSSFWNGRWL